MRYCVLFAGFLSVAAYAADVVVMEEIVCKVNGDIITRTELERDRKASEADLRRQGLTGAQLQNAATDRIKTLLRDRIDQMLLVQKAKELNLNVDADVNKQLADIQRQANVADPEKFQALVREQTGQSFEDYKSDLKNGLLTQRVIREEVGGKIKFKKEDLQAYYDQHKDEFQRQERVFLRAILVSTQGKDQAGIDAAEKKAKDLSARAKRGEKFPELAQANSDDTATARDGGALDPATKGTLRAELETAVWDQPRGFVTDPIKLPNGFMVLRVEDHQRAGLASFEEVEPEVQDKLFRPRMEPAMRVYLTKLREDAFLEIKPGFEDSGAAPGKNTAWTDPAELKPQTVTKEELAAKGRRRHLLGMPIPGTQTKKAGTSSSR